MMMMMLKTMLERMVSSEQDDEVQLNVDLDVGRMENIEEEYERFQERELQTNNNRKKKKVKHNSNAENVES